MNQITFTYIQDKVRQSQKERKNGSEPQYIELKSLMGGFMGDFYFTFICFYNLLGLLQ